jgi:predicted acetyltransferase
MDQMQPEVEIYRAPPDEMAVLSNLLQLYLYEFSASVDNDVADDGRYEWDGFEDYWREEGLHPFMVRVEGNLAGFALVQNFSVLSQAPIVWDMEDFFILAKYRGRGIGQTVARNLFHMFPGAWEIRVLRGNENALKFWHSTISRDSGYNVEPVPVDIEGRVFDVFQFVTQP